MKVIGIRKLLVCLFLSIASTVFASEKFELPKIKEEKTPLTILGPAGEIFEFIRTGTTTCGKYLISKTIVPPGAGPLPHVHHWTDEWFYTPNGGIVLFMGETEYPDVKLAPGEGAKKDVLHVMNMHKGELIYGPRYYVHGFINNTNKPQTLYLFWTPDKNDVSILNYFKQVGQAVHDPNNLPAIEPISKLRFVSEGPRFGINQSHDFWQYVQGVKYSDMKMDNHSAELLQLLKEGENCFPAKG